MIYAHIRLSNYKYWRKKSDGIYTHHHFFLAWPTLSNQPTITLRLIMHFIMSLFNRWMCVVVAAACRSTFLRFNILILIFKCTGLVSVVSEYTLFILIVYLTVFYMEIVFIFFFLMYFIIVIKDKKKIWIDFSFFLYFIFTTYNSRFKISSDILSYIFKIQVLYLFLYILYGKIMYAIHSSLLAFYHNINRTFTYKKVKTNTFFKCIILDVNLMKKE